MEHGRAGLRVSRGKLRGDRAGGSRWATRAVLAAALGLGTVLGTGRLVAPARADEPAAAATPVVERWLLLDLDAGGPREPFRPSAAFRRYLLAPSAEAPEAGVVVEAADGSHAAWRPAVPDERGFVDPDEASYAAGTVTASADGVWLASVERAGALFVNGTPFVGDAYGHGIVRVPVELRAGANALFVLAPRGPFRVRFERPEAPLFVATEDPTLPDLVRGESRAPDAAVVVVNASTTLAIGVDVEGTVHVGDRRVSGGVRLVSIPPLGVTKVPLVLRPIEVPDAAEEARLDVELANCDRVIGHWSFPLPVVSADAPRRRTFVSAIDGGVQTYALLPPVGDAKGAPRRMLLTLHGAGVQALGQVKAYAPKPDFVIVAPTNRRPFGFDWQQWGRLDAYEVLADALSDTGVDRRRVSLSGHSMGGHGTWHLAVNDPDGFAVVAPSAAWVSFATYAGGPRDGPLARLWDAADAPSDTLALADNLAAVPVRQLHGEADDCVPVSEARTMEARLNALPGMDYALQVIPKMGHWWDGDASPGADCVDWPAFFDAFRAHEIPEAPAALHVTTADPAEDSADFWVRLEQPIQVGELLHVDASFAGGALTVATKNVRRLSLAPPAAWKVGAVHVDGTDVLWPAETPRLALARSGGTWRVVADRIPAGERSPGRSGPFWRLFDRRFVLVYGTAGDASEDRQALERARYDAERWWYRGNGAAETISDAELLAHAPRYVGRNVVLYGNASTNAAWDHVLPPSCPLRVDRGRAVVGARTYEGDDLAALFLYPRLGDEGALAGAVAWTGEKGERATIPCAYLSSGVGFPDYVLFGPEVFDRGDTGVRTAGLFDVAWHLATGR